MEPTMDEVQEAIRRLSAEDEDHLTRHEDGRVTVHLESTVEYRNGKRDPEKIDEVTFRKSKGKDWAQTDRAKGEIAKMILLASACSNLPKAAFDEMDGDDFLRCVRVVGSMGKFPNAGGSD